MYDVSVNKFSVFRKPPRHLCSGVNWERLGIICIKSNIN